MKIRPITTVKYLLQSRLRSSKLSPLDASKDTRGVMGGGRCSKGWQKRGAMSKPDVPMGWIKYVCPQHSFYSQFNGDEILAGGPYPEDIMEHKRQFHGASRKSVRLGGDDRRVPSPGPSAGPVDEAVPREPDTDTSTSEETREGGIRIKRVPYAGG